MNKNKILVGWIFTILFATIILPPTAESHIINIQTIEDNISVDNLFYQTNTSLNWFEQPPMPIRQPAEFEPMEGVLIRYPFGISYDIIAEMAEDVNIVTIVADTSEQQYVESQYQNHGVNLDYCSFLIAPSNTYWTRDYGPWFIFDGNNEQAVIDFTYNRPRPDDNAIPSAYAADQGLSLYTMPLVHTGGNYMTDGQGVAVSTDLVWSENPDYTSEEIDQIVYDYLGITTYHVVPDALGEYIKHIDCWAKLLAPDEIMIIKTSPTHPHYNDIEAAVNYFSNQISCYGTPYRIKRVYVDTGEPYINSLILNDKVFVPITGSEWDDEALEAYEDAMPGYEVLGFTGSWLSTDALHCRVKGIPDRYMLYIEHTPLHGEQKNGENGFEIQANITPYSGTNLIMESTRVYYKVENNPWQSVQMQPIGDNRYHAFIPAQPDGVTVYYYIHAEDYSGRSENHPYIGAPGAHSFTVYNPGPNNPPETPETPNGPTSGFTGVSYTYSTVTVDPENDEVKYGWDWDGDYVVDEWTGFYSSGTIIGGSHSWETAGFYNVRVKAEDTHGSQSEFSPGLQVEILSSNSPPYPPNNPFPMNGSEDISIDSVLTWDGGDPDPGDQVTYDVYFDTSTPPSKVVSNQTANVYKPILKPETTYYWRIVAWDNHNTSTSGPIWVFTTGMEDNEIPAVRITKPKFGIYVANKRVLPFLGTIVIGSIDVEVDASDNTGVDHVDFYVDDVLRATDDAAPYVWTWSEKTFFRHTIKAVAYDAAGNYGIDEITVWRFL
ncbi:MAG TPA: hypothetical protein ENL13_04545 [Thermoplasmatales archaeon]|nr:hypothetical protein [Thermoplasmatales archaeon]